MALLFPLFFLIPVTATENKQLFQISKYNKKYKVWTRQYRKSQVHDKNIIYISRQLDWDSDVEDILPIPTNFWTV